MKDRRKEFKNEFWLQGRLLFTGKIKEMDAFIKDNKDERRTCFYDDGKKRVLVHKFKTADECKREVGKHNQKILNKLIEKV